MKKPHYIPPEMVFVQGGKMQLGEKLELTVDLPDFWIGKFPVTNEEFVHFLNAEGNQGIREKTWYLIDNHSGINTVNNKFQLKPEKRKHPVVNISWYGASGYCQWLSQQTSHNYQLPSETEWEYAARGGQASRDFVYAGSNKLKEISWCKKNSRRRTERVGLKLCNELGIYDMSGNVWEHCEDVYNYDFSKTPSDGKAQKNNTASYSSCTLRGGSWHDFDEYCRVAVRYYKETFDRFGEVGFRLARY